jgi:hypothetical protein
MLENEFYQIFNDFLKKHKISPLSNIESIKNEWIPFLNITELHPESCICGHKIKHITYLFNIHNKHILFIGSSCCKKYGLLEKHLENDLLSHILKTQISRHSFEKNENIVLLKNSLDILIKEYIFEKFRLYTHKYSREMDENSYYFDVFKPLKKMEKDILELIEKYNFDLVDYYDEISQFLKEREISNHSDSETNSQILEKLENIENEINQLLDIKDDDGLCYISENQPNLGKGFYFENERKENLGENILQENLGENIFQENLGENIFQEKFEEKDFALNLKIEQDIQNELKNEKERFENEYDFYENCEIYYEEEPDKLKTISKFSQYSSYHWNSNINMKLLNYIIESNEKEIQEIKKNVKTHIENIERLKQQVYEFKTFVKTSNLSSK